MQGSGTSSDPYLPTTLSEFLSVCNQSSACIKLTQDIDAYDDPTYVGELTSEVVIRPTRLYADTPVAIKNVTVRASRMIYFGANSAIERYVENIHFLNWIHKKIDDSGSINYITYPNGYSNHISNCKFSVKIDNGPYIPMIFDKYDSSSRDIYFKYCSFYFEYAENMNRFSFNNAKLTVNRTGLSFTYCNIIIKNLNVQTVGTSYLDSPLLYLWKLEKTSIIFDTIKIYTSSGANDAAPISYIMNDNNSSVSYSYIAFVNPIITWTSGPSSYPPYIYMQYSNSTYPYHNCLFATSSTKVNTSTGTLGSGVTRLTLEQLKNKEYLEGIGWLP